MKNKFLRISNELVEQFAKHNIPGTEMRIVWVVWRKTWCWKDGDRRKDFDWVSISQFEKMTGIKRANIHKAIKSLLCKRIITVMQKDNGHLFYGFNKRFNEWVLCKRITPCKRYAKGYRGVMQKDNKTVMQKDKHKRKKETITKEIDTNVSTEQSSEFGNKKINDILKALKSVVGIEAFVDSKIERNIARHCLGLLKKIGRDEFKKRLLFLLDDGFTSKNCNKIKFIYNNIKGFKKPKSKTIVI